MPKLAALGLALFLAGCGGAVGNSPAVSVSITPTSASVHVTHRCQFTASVHGSAKQSVSWELSGGDCDAASCGAITATGVYMAPPIVPSRAEVTITARALVDSGKSAVAMVTVLPAIVVTVSPVSPNVRVRQTQQFTAKVRNAANSEVAWTVTGTGCEGPACGTVDANGLYTAPAALPSPATVTVTATSVEDSSKSDAAAVMIVPAIIASTRITNALPELGKFPWLMLTLRNAINTNRAVREIAQRRGATCAAEL